MQRWLVSEWGAGHFSIDDEGFARVAGAPGAPSARIDAIIADLRRRGFRSPFLLRFPQILQHRVRRLHQAFAKAIDKFDYPERYQGVYPVKVNQQREVVEALVSETADHAYGLEVGSKGELVLALTQELDSDAFIICNGFKDPDFIELALRGRGEGLNVILICETFSEVAEIVAIAKEVGVAPWIGMRARLHTAGAGRWVESGGSHAKFGLTTLEMLQCVSFLERAGYPEALRCLHFHIGSQISDILPIKEAIKEAARLYCHLRRKAPGLTVLDLGGGLGVDYDGSSTASDWSHNYTIEEYCRDAVYNVQSVCEQEKVPPPRLVSESGRSVTAYGTMVAISPIKLIGRTTGAEAPPLPDNPCLQVIDLSETFGEMRQANWRESVNDARALHEEVLLGFKMGFVGLEDRAAGEALYQDICRKALELLDPADEDPDEIAELMTTVAPMAVCNFSVFQSTPDTWAVRQVFPIMPLSQLEQRPTVPMTIGDITCDSDGRIDDFLREEGGTGKVLLMPRLDLQRPYLIGIFLTGAYQDTLGDMHNLFGSANEASVVIEGEDRFTIRSISRGTTVSEALELFGFGRAEVVSRFEDRYGADDAPARNRFRDSFLRVLSSGTYLRR